MLQIKGRPSTLLENFWWWGTWGWSLKLFMNFKAINNRDNKELEDKDVGCRLFIRLVYRLKWNKCNYSLDLVTRSHTATIVRYLNRHLYRLSPYSNDWTSIQHLTNKTSAALIIYLEQIQFKIQNHKMQANEADININSIAFFCRNPKTKLLDFA